jgi:hypothetical protein
MAEHEAAPVSGTSKLLSKLGAQAKKAWAGGTAGATLAIGGISVSGFWADGHVDTGKVAAAAGTIVVGFVGGFLAVFFAPANVPDPASPTLQPAAYAPTSEDLRDVQ